MSINKLFIQNLRIIKQVDIETSVKLNVIFGKNASGKTSFLEAIYFLSTARSFRTRQVSEVIKHDTDSMIIGAQVKQSSGKIIPLGIKSSNKKILMKVNGEAIERISELAKFLPVQIIHPESHQLVLGGPKLRRQFLNWGVFHVEHEFYVVWARYQRALKQKNSALRQRMRDMDGVWDSEIDQIGNYLHDMRVAYLDKFCKILPKYTQAIMGNQYIEIIYQPGWDSEKTLASVLKENKARDRQRGYTTQGPHRAELVLKVNGYKAQDKISRGQQKMLVSALRLAQSELYSDLTQLPCVILVDDLPAELDEQHCYSLMELLRNMNAQIFVSCMKKDQIDLSAWDDKRMFHVEQGVFSEVE